MLIQLCLQAALRPCGPDLHPLSIRCVSHLDPQLRGACGLLLSSQLQPVPFSGLNQVEWPLRLGLAGFSMASLLHHLTPRLNSWLQTPSSAFGKILSGNPDRIGGRLYLWGFPPIPLIFQNPEQREDRPSFYSSLPSPLMNLQ